MAKTAKKKAEEKDPLEKIIFNIDSDLKRYDDFYKIVDHPDDPNANYKCIELIKGDLRRFSSDLASYETVQKVALISTEFSIEGKELTPTLKLRRKEINKKYQDLIESLYDN